VISGMNGVELATYFARHFPACKVLLISGNAATAGMLKDAVRHHNFSFMQKPVPPQRILEFLANCTSIA
jgi:DNA-binding NtrC family response regulator